MFKLPLLTISTVLLVPTCAFLYAAPPPATGASPDADTVLKAMSNRLASAKQYRFTVSRTMPTKVAQAMNQQTKANVEVAVARPDKLSARITHQGVAVREMFFDGRTFTVVDGVNRFHSQAPLRGSVDAAAGQLEKLFGFRPPLVEFVVSNPYREIKNRVEAVSYLGQDTVRQGGRAVKCHRIGLRGNLADAELWLGAEDSLPRRLKATRSNSGGKDLLADMNFVTWDFNPRATAFRFQAPANFEKIPMITLAEANTKPKP